MSLVGTPLTPEEDDDVPHEVKRLRTKETETEFHDPLRFQQAKSYVRATLPSFGRFHITKVVPNDCCYPENIRENTECRDV